MLTSATSVVVMVLVALAFVALIALRPRLTMRRGGKVLAFFALFLFPVLTATVGTGHHLERAESTEFCLSCHEMEPYGESLWLDDSDHLPASHYQNRRVSRQEACYACHTNYTLFGGAKDKLRGLRHVWVHYLGTPPEQLALYEPYQNRECLHCHDGARSFEESDLHLDVRSELASGEISCLECHEWVHAVSELEEMPRWEPAAEGPP